LPDLMAVAESPTVRFDAILGRNSLTQCPDKEAMLRLLHAWQQPGGMISLAEVAPRHTQRLYALITLDDLSAGLAERIRQAEEAIYARTDDPMVNWDAARLEQAALSAGFEVVSLDTQELHNDRVISREQVMRWFARGAERPSYGDHLAQLLDAQELEQIAAAFTRQLVGKTVSWASQVCYLVARRPSSG
jgi:putative ATPase